MTDGKLLAGSPPALDPTAAGLCGRCLHRRLQTTPNTVFVRCARAVKDPSYPRYPRLPVLSCRGFVASD